MTITYSQVGDYLLPDIVLSDPPDAEPLTAYGMMRKSFLKTHHQAHYGLMLVSEKLYPHCREIQRQALERFNMLMENFVTSNPPPDKATDGMAWASHMTMLKRTAEEIVASEIIYSFPQNAYPPLPKKYSKLHLLK
jgi:hypothetical protein